MTMTKDPIQLININEELSHLWESGQGAKRTRASLFNFILYVQKTERLPFYESLIKSVVSKFPCRVMMIVSEEEKKYLRTSVNSEIISEGELQIYCELIRIEVGGALAERVPFILIPHILPDLPVYLLWTQDPATENTILPHLEPLADRIIFDPESTHDLQLYAKSVLSLQQRFHCAIGDLNWSALSGWRQLFRQVFDSFDPFLDLVQSKVMRIRYNKTPNRNTEIEAAYLQAWIASRLNWQFQRVEITEGSSRVSYHTPTHEVAILLIPEEVSELSPGTLLGIEIECEKNNAHYVFKRHPKTRQVFVQFSNKERCNLPTCSYLSGVSEGREIIEEIFYPSTGPHYREMLEILTAASWKR